MPKRTKEGKIKPGFILNLSRHNIHSIELKSGLSLRDRVIEGELNLYLFYPSNIPVERWPREELQKDFFSRLRLAIPHKANLDTQRARENILNLIDSYKQNNDPQILQELGGIVGEFLSREAKFFISYVQSFFEKEKKDIEKKESRLLFSRILVRCQDIERLMQNLRGILGEEAKEKKTTQNLFAHYIHQSHLHFLAQVRSQIEHCAKSYPMPKKIFAELEKHTDKIDVAIANEFEFKKRFLLNAGEVSEASTMDELITQSHLKKYFQSRMYLDIGRKNAVKKFMEPLAAIAAASAGAIAMLVQQFSMKPILVSAGSTGIAVAGCGIALYVLRDRLKDQGKTYLKNKVSRYLPDQEQELVANSEKIGQIREWFAVTEKSKLRSKIRNLRHKCAVTAAEREIPEDVVHIKRLFNIFRKEGTELMAQHLDLQETLRINFDRYLPYMDDEEKRLPILDKNGSLAEKVVHKQYYFHLALEAKFRNEENSKRSVRTLYRVVLDKSGIQDLVRIRG